MRILVPLLAGGAILLAAWCSAKPASRQAQTSVTPRPSATADTTMLYAIHPRDLILPAEQMIPGVFTVSYNDSLVTGQWSRVWERDASDPAAASGASRVVIASVLYLTLDEAVQEWAANGEGPAADDVVQRSITQRGILPQNLRMARIPDWEPLGMDGQVAWRAEFTPSGPEDTYTEYWVLMRSRNVRIILRAVAHNVSGAEAPNLRGETRELARRQAQHLLSLKPA